MGFTGVTCEAFAGAAREWGELWFWVSLGRGQDQREQVLRLRDYKVKLKMVNIRGKFPDDKSYELLMDG